MHQNKRTKMTDAQVEAKLQEVIDELDAIYFGQKSRDEATTYRNLDKTYKQLRQEIQDRKNKR